MKIFATSILIFASVVTPAFSPAAQEPQDEDYERVVVGTNEILLDAVVKDKKGHVVKDLKPSDFEIYEDGVRQDVKSFNFITRGQTMTPGASDAKETPTTSQPAAPPRGTSPANTNRISAVALVFDRLSPDARKRAHNAALSYVGNEVRSDDFIGVFNIDLSLRAIQSFTNDGRLIRQAIDHAVAQPPASFSSNTGQITGLSQSQAALQSQSATAAQTAMESNGQDMGSAGAIAAAQQLAEMTQRAVEGFERLERNQQGFATTEGLLAILNAMGRLPGRKALIFFSEGVAIPPAVQSHFRSVISAANRANVSIYTVDAAGLRVESVDAEAGRAMVALGQKRARIAGSPSDGTGGPMTRDLERNEDLLRLNPESGLGQLADQTGGILISNTNNPGTRLRQVDEDLHAYYLLSYSPANQNFDGHFRQISLKVNRPGVEVQARKGYYAISNSYDTPVLDYEVPALALLSGRPPQPDAFVSRVAAFNFPETGKPGLVPLMVEVPASSINFVLNNEKKSYSTNFSVIVLIEDEAGHVVRKLSAQYLLGGQLDKLEAAKGGKILFYRETQLVPGRYTLKSVVYDATNERASKDTGSLNVSDADQSRLRLSSIVIIKSAEKLTANEQGTPNPFHFGEVLIYPNMNEPLRKSAIKNVAFFVTVYPPQGSASATKLKLEIVQGGKVLGQTSTELPAPDSSGRIQYASAIPIDKYKPGDYELRVTVQNGQSTASRAEHFTITP
ncbi:MAG TPA: VWA domain-containing protein [Pyrinomonadaceae bacterium]|jgi:VWFA-related protein